VPPRGAPPRAALPARAQRLSRTLHPGREGFSCCQQRECTVGTWVGATVGGGGAALVQNASTAPLAVCAQVHTTYGAKSNAQMLFSFGTAPQPAGCRASTRAGLTRVMFHVVL
jgi:hypothetical protein